MPKMYGCKEEQIVHYICKRTHTSININGNLEKEVWKKAQKSSPFVDMVTGEPAFLQTQMAALWDENNLYVAYWIEEPNIQAKLTKRDSLIFTENDVELFIAGKDCYYEFEINALGTCYEVFFVWQDAYKKGSRFEIPEFDLITNNVDVLGGFQDESRYGAHPRGKRWAFVDWDFPELKAKVKIQGTLNDASDRDEGWTVEIALPWKGMKSLFGKEIIPLENLDTLRMDFSRFQKLSYNAVKVTRHPGWSLNAHGVYDSHIPRCFSYIHLKE